MLTLYGARGSGSAAVEMALRICAQPYNVVQAASWEPGSDRAGLVRVNPLGLVPVLVLADGTVITESAAILIHLGLEHPQTPLLPTPAAARARSIRGLTYLAANCYPAIGIIDYPQRWTTADDTQEHERVRSAARHAAACMHTGRPSPTSSPPRPIWPGPNRGRWIAWRR